MKMARIGDVGAFVSDGVKFAREKQEFFWWGYSRLATIIVASAMLLAIVAWKTIAYALKGNVAVVGSGLLAMPNAVAVIALATLSIAATMVYWNVLLVKGSVEYAATRKASVEKAEKNAITAAVYYVAMMVVLVIIILAAAIVITPINATLSQLATHVLSWAFILAPYCLLAGGAGVIASLTQSIEYFKSNPGTIIVSTILTEIISAILALAGVVTFLVISIIALAIGKASPLAAFITAIIGAIVLAGFLAAAKTFSTATLASMYNAASKETPKKRK